MKINFIYKTNNIFSLIEKIDKASYVSIDTESNGLYCYEENICLLQIEFGGEVYIIDPFTVDIKLLVKIFENPNIEKIFHSANSDILLLKKSFSCNFINIFDIMIASKYIFKKGFSLKDLVERYFGIQMTKKYQKINWAKRPLSNDAIRYAAYDVFYLKKIRDIFYCELINKGVYNQFRKYCEKLNSISLKKKEFIPQKYVSLGLKYGFNEDQILLLIEIAKKREEIARQKNLPLFRILKNSDMISIIINKNNNLLIPDWVNDVFQNFFKNKTNKTLYSISQIYDQSYNLRLKVLKKWRSIISEDEKIAPELILSKNEIKRIALFNLITNDILKECGIDEERIEKYGIELIEYYNKETKSI
ncbi:MAG: ribonuclease D [Elusimicrobiales bacterium]|nr:ribonuclease D [Elusimicrobiales bacterium]